MFLFTVRPQSHLYSRPGLHYSYAARQEAEASQFHSDVCRDLAAPHLCSEMLPKSRDSESESRGRGGCMASGLDESHHSEVGHVTQEARQSIVRNIQRNLPGTLQEPSIRNLVGFARIPYPN